MDDEQVSLLENSLTEEVDKVPTGSYVLKFLNCWPLRGAFVCHYKEPRDRDWLLEVAKTLRTWQNAVLTVIESSKLPKLERVLDFVLGSLEQGTVLTRLARQNETLNVPSWTVLGTKKVETEESKVTETAVTVVIQGSEVKAFEALGYRPFCAIRRSHCAQQKQDKVEALALEAMDMVPAEDTGEVANPELVIDS